MQQRLLQFGHQLHGHIADWLAARVDESRHCRDCDAVVSPWDEVCSDCGTSNPARVQISPMVYVGVGLVVAGILIVVQLM
jgi:predicted nucleic acid-binding Zn ribbon protein